MLIGGFGGDRLAGNQEDDILVAGYTSHEGSDLARQMLADALAWFPDRQLVLIGDGGFSAHNLLRDLDERVTYVSLMRGNTALHEPRPSARRKGTSGPKPKHGPRLPKPREAGYGDVYLSTTRLDADPAWVVQTAACRTSIEAAFKDSKQVLEIQKPQHWCQASIEKLAPYVWLMQSLVTLWYFTEGRNLPAARAARKQLVLCVI